MRAMTSESAVRRAHLSSRWKADGGEASIRILILARTQLSALTRHRPCPRGRAPQ